MEKIAILTSSFGVEDKRPISIIEGNGIKITLNPYGRKLTKEEIVPLCKDSIGIISGTEILDEAILGQLKGLAVISRCGAGLDNVDLACAKRLGIKIFNTPDAPTAAVSELTIGLMLNLLRKVNVMDAGIRKDKWEKLMGNLLNEKKIGIIGFGKIGRKVAYLLSRFGCEIAYSDPNVEDGVSGYKRMPIEDLLKWADIISIHASAKNKIIGSRELALMKKGSWIVNISRGTSLDEDALYKSLKSGHVAGAALDVFEQEPYNGPLKALANVILTPHIGSYAREARIKMELESAENLLKGLKEAGRIK